MSAAKNTRPTNPPLLSIQHFSRLYPDFTEGSVKWLIFNKRQELLDEGVIRYWGKKYSFTTTIPLLTSSTTEPRNFAKRRFQKFSYIKLRKNGDIPCHQRIPLDLTVKNQNKLKK